MATANFTSTTFIEIAVTDACAQALGGGNVTSAQCDALEAEYANNTPEFESAECTFSPGACWCTIFGVPEVTAATDPYSANGNQLIIGSEVTDYCVDGDRLTMGSNVAEGSFTITARRAP
jgi:hypothetical protein